MTQTYRTDDQTKWGTGKGSNLTAAEVDINFWDAIQRIVTLESAGPPSASIASFTVSGSQFYVVLTDSTTLGPYTLPVSQFRSRGAWLPSTAYALLDTVTANGGLYLVIFAHTSGLTFSPTANDGAGHDYYSLMIQTPGSSLPTGGAAGQVLQKSSGTDYLVTWGNKTPTGGTARQYIIKTNSTQDNAAWGTPQADDIHFTPPTGSTISSTNVAAALEEIASDAAAGTSLTTLTDVNITAPVLGGLLFYNGTDWASSTFAATGATLTFDGSTWVPAVPTVSALVDTVEFIIDGGGSTITAGLKGYIEVPFACTITGNTVLGDASGSIVINIYKCTYSQFDAGATHPVVGDKITASAPPTISSATKSQNTTITGWITSVSAGDILAINVDSVTTMQRVTLSLKVSR